MPDYTFCAFFKGARNQEPNPYQERLATARIESRLMHVPAGYRKSAAVILSSTWQWKTSPGKPPRRFVYCLTKREMMARTLDNSKTWLTKLNLQG